MLVPAFWISFLPFPAPFPYSSTGASWDQLSNKPLHSNPVSGLPLEKPSRRQPLGVFIPDLTSLSLLSEEWTRSVFSVAPAVAFTACAHCLTCCPYIISFITHRKLVSWCNAHFKDTLVYRVLCYQWFQASTGGLGTHPPWIKGDYYVLITDAHVLCGRIRVWWRHVCGTSKSAFLFCTFVLVFYCTCLSFF